MVRQCAGGVWALIAVAALASSAQAHVPIGGFIPYMGIGLTNEFETFDSDPTGAFSIADPSFQWGGSPLGPGSSAYFDIALVDTGAATHIITQAAGSATGFAIQAEGFRGTNFQTIFGASGSIDLRINDPLGFYAVGLADRTSAGTALTLNTSKMRGQTSVAILEAPAAWTLPNIIGLPMAAQHAISVRNDQPQLFQHQGRTVRTPNIELIDLGSGGAQGVSRWTNLKARPSASFLAGPLYIQNFEIGGGLEFNFHDNPLSPTVVDSGALMVEVDMARGNRSFQDKEFLFDTGADITVVSAITASRLGFDVINDRPDFVLEVEGAGGVTDGVPGFYLDELNIDAVGGSFTLQNVPVAVIDLPGPSDPMNVVDGILGMHLFTGRNLVIDAAPAPHQPGQGPRLYIGDPVTTTHAWAANAPVGEIWSTASNWTPAATPDILWDAQVVNNSGGARHSAVTAHATVHRLTVGANDAGSMNVTISPGVTLTTFGETLIDDGGTITLLDTGVQAGKLDAQFVNIDGGTLAGAGDVFVGTGPVTGAVRNISGRVAPSRSAPSLFPVGRLHVIGDFANLTEATLAIDLAGVTAGVEYDQLTADRHAFLAGTLEVSLAGNFTPTVGNTFTILTAADGLFGQFENLVLPSGFQWGVSYSATSVILEVAGLATLAGDFDGNGSVNAADLAVWRNGFGTLYDANDFLDWQRNLKTPGGAGAVPEPRTALLVVGASAMLVLAVRRGRRVRRFGLVA